MFPKEMSEGFKAIQDMADALDLANDRLQTLIVFHNTLLGVMKYLTYLYEREQGITHTPDFSTQALQDHLRRIEGIIE